VKVRLATIFFLLLSSLARAGEIQGACDVRFLGSSTLHDFSGTGRCEPFSAPLVRDAAGKTILPSVVVEVPVAAMKTGNDSRDGSMWEMLQADRYPRIRATARDVDTDRVRDMMRKDPEGKAPLEISLAIRGAERKIRATARNLKEAGSRVSFDLEFPLSLKEFDLKAPTVLGFIRVADKVLVKGTFALDVPQAP